MMSPATPSMLPRFIEQAIFVEATHEQTTAPLISWNSRNVAPLCSLPTALSEAYCHAFYQRGRLSTYGLLQFCFPFLEDPERGQAVPCKGSSLHFRSHRLLAEFINPKHRVCKVLDLSHISCATAFVNKLDKPSFDCWKQARPFAVFPEGELWRVRDFKAFKKAGDKQSLMTPCRQDIARYESIDVKVKVLFKQPNMFARSLQSPLAQPRTKCGECRGQGMSCLRYCDIGPQ